MDIHVGYPTVVERWGGKRKAAAGVRAHVVGPVDAAEHPSAQLAGAPAAPAHARMDTCVYANTPGAFLYSLFPFPTKKKEKKPQLFIYEITRRPFSKGTWLPWVTRCLSATGVILLTAAITGRG